MIALLIAFAFQAAADVPLANPRLEARAQHLMREIRCVVCENEPVSQSTAEVAIDMRRTIREQVANGATDDNVRGFFVERYGEKVTFRPSADGWRILLWLFPFLLLGGAATAILSRSRSRRGAALAPLAEDAVEDPKS